MQTYSNWSQSSRRTVPSTKANSSFISPLLPLPPTLASDPPLSPTLGPLLPPTLSFGASTFVPPTSAIHLPSLSSSTQELQTPTFLVLTSPFWRTSLGVLAASPTTRYHAHAVAPPTLIRLFQRSLSRRGRQIVRFNLRLRVVLICNRAPHLVLPTLWVTPILLMSTIGYWV